jgi:hypothetical protein
LRARSFSSWIFSLKSSIFLQLSFLLVQLLRYSSRSLVDSLTGGSCRPKNNYALAASSNSWAQTLEHRLFSRPALSHNFPTAFIRTLSPLLLIFHVSLLFCMYDLRTGAPLRRSN